MLYCCAANTTQINAFDRLYPEYIKTFDDRKEYLNQAMKADSMFRTFIQVRAKQH